MKVKPLVLVVDDQPINVKMLERLLVHHNMDVLKAYNGYECLEILDHHLPDLILLDIMMPGMDGITVCRHIREREKIRQIPVIFITARATREGKIEGLEAGAADYITKPLDFEETLARINTQLRIQENHRLNLDLKDRLADTRHAAAIGAIAQGIAHNLNNLLGIVSGYIDLIKTFSENPERVRKSAHSMEQAIDRMVTILRQLTIMASSDQAISSKHVLANLLHNAIERFRIQYNIKDTVNLPSAIPHIELATNAEMFEEIFSRLLINAWESYESENPNDSHKGPREMTIEVRVNKDSDPAMLEIDVLDRGRGVDSSIEDHMFDPFVSSKSAVGHGLGLTIARHNARSIGGEIRIDARPGGGTRARVNHPLEAPTPI